MTFLVKTLLCAYLKGNPIILCSLYVVAVYEKLQIQVPALKTFPFCSTMRDCTILYFLLCFKYWIQAFLKVIVLDGWMV